MNRLKYWFPRLLLLLVPMLVVAATVVTKISDFPNVSAPAPTDLFLLARPGQTNFNIQSKQLFSNNTLGGNTYISNAYITNLTVENEFVNNLYASNFITTNFIINNFSTNLFSSNAFFTNLFVSQTITSAFLFTINNSNVIVHAITNVFTVGNGGRLYVTNITVQDGATNLFLLPNALMKTDANKAESSVTNGTGFLFNDGSGVFSWQPFIVQTNFYFFTTNIYLQNNTVSNYFVTNVFNDTFVSNFISTNFFVSNAFFTIISTNIMQENNYISNFFNTNIFVNNSFVSNYFVTNIFTQITTNFSITGAEVAAGTNINISTNGLLRTISTVANPVFNSVSVSNASANPGWLGIGNGGTNIITLNGTNGITTGSNFAVRALSPNSLVQSDGSAPPKLLSIANQAGFLVNDGNGNFAWQQQATAIQSNFFFFNTNIFVNNTTVSNYFVTNVFNDTYVSNYVNTNFYITNISTTSFITNIVNNNDYVSNFFQTNIFVNNSFVSNYFVTNIFSVTNLVISTNAIQNFGILVVHKDGSTTNYFPPNNTDLGRGIALKQAVDAAVDRDFIFLAENTYDLAGLILRLDTSDGGGASIFGASMEGTVLKTSAVLSGTNGVAIRVGNGTKLSDFTLNTYSDTGLFLLPVGSFGGNAFTNVLIERLAINGNSDDIYMFNTNVCSVTIRDCRFTSHWDCFYLNLRGTVTIQNVTTRSVASTASGFATLGQGISIPGTNLVVNSYDCDYHGTNGTIGSYGILIGGSNAVINVYGGRAFGANYDLNPTQGGSINVSPATVWNTKSGGTAISIFPLVVSVIYSMTNAWAGPTNNLSALYADQYYDSPVPINVTNFTDLSLNLSHSIQLTVKNTSATNWTARFPANTFQANGATGGSVVTNGQRRTFWFKVINGTMTNEIDQAW